ncbi:hypothetical protein EV715DRAFT_214647, partial [Schizophyllum commune]
HLQDLSKGFHVSTIVATATTLALHLFQTVSRIGSNFTLEAFRYFAFAHTWLAEGTGTSFQNTAMNAIPHDVRTLIKRFDLDVDLHTYAVCPKCSSLHRSTVEHGRDVWPSTCVEPVFGSAKLCQEPLLETSANGTIYPTKTLVHVPFADWFGRFIALPGVEEYGDQFCRAVDAHASAPSAKASPADGDLIHSFPSPHVCEGKEELFIADRGEEGRWLFILEADFFNVEGNLAGGASRSTGVVALVCLNLPLSIRNDDAYRYPAFVLGGPKEPDSKQAHHQHSMRLLVDDLLQSYDGGLLPFHSHASHLSGKRAYGRIHRVGIAGVLGDLKGGRPFCGITDASSHPLDPQCRVWHQTSLSATDWKGWGHADNAYLRTGAELWQNATDAKTRKLIEKFFGVRGAQVWRFSYWDVTRQLIVDPMHAIYLGDCRRHFTEGLGLYDPKPGVIRSKQSELLAIKNTFQHLPPLSELTLELPSDPLDIPLVQGLSDGDLALREKVGQYLRDHEKSNDELRKTEASPEALAYVCRELDCHPGENDKEKLIVSLMDWRILQRHQGLDWAPINSHEVLQRLHDCLRQLMRPSWVVRPQLDVGLPSARKVKAAHWKRMYEVPASMSGPLQTAMHLSCACLSMIADVSTEEQRDKFSSLFAQHLDGLERDCPGISTPNHHVSFHIRDFMSLLGPVRNWWCFPFERLVSRMQRTGNNHRAGTSLLSILPPYGADNTLGYEKTLLSTFYERAFFRQTLLRINIPYVQDFRRTMDRLFHFDDKDDEGEGEDDDDDDKNQDDDSDVGDPAEVELDDSGEIITFQSPASPLRFDLSQRLRSVPLLPRGDGRNTDAGTIPAAGVRIGGKTYSAVRERHSYVGFRSHKSAQKARWTAGKIVRIAREGGKLKFHIRPFAPVEACRNYDPFSAFWNDGFEAQSVSHLTSDEVEVSLAKSAVFHVAYWKLTEGWGVALSLEKVRPEVISDTTAHPFPQI